jgi:hypothetical protein
LPLEFPGEIQEGDFESSANLPKVLEDLAEEVLDAYVSFVYSLEHPSLPGGKDQ